MAARYHKSEVAIIKAMYATETEEAIMAKLPDRNWIAVCRYARSYLGLYRIYGAKRLEMLAGQLEAKRTREEKENSS